MNFDWLLYCAITDSCYAVTVQLENNCTATKGTIYTGYAINDITDRLNDGDQNMASGVKKFIRSYTHMQQSSLHQQPLSLIHFKT